MRWTGSHPFMSCGCDRSFGCEKKGNISHRFPLKCIPCTRMGLLVDGEWHDQWYDTKASGGRFIRADAQYRNWVTKDGSPGPTGIGGFKAEPGRYHLYVSLACPWAHRTIIMRKMKGLEEMISISVVNWQMFENGWTFHEAPGVIPDPINSATYMHQVCCFIDLSAPWLISSNVSCSDLHARQPKIQRASHCPSPLR